MPPKGNQKRHKKPNKRKQPVPDAMANSVFPREIMLCILTRLPVKSLLRFKSVCKPWLKLFSTPKFVKLHHHQFSQDPRNHSFMVYSLSSYYDHTMSLLNLSSVEKKLTNLDHPFPEIFFRMDFVGCWNGLVCMACPPLGQAIFLWNPAMKLFKGLRLSMVDFGNPEFVSLGFGYDSDGDDFKVVRAVCLDGKKKGKKIGVEVYSAKNDSWKTIKMNSSFRLTTTNCGTISNGNPCWIANFDNGDFSCKSGYNGFVARFDVKKEVFDEIPVPETNLKMGASVHLIDWKGFLALFVWFENQRLNFKNIEIWVFGDGDRAWNKQYTLCFVDMRIHRFMQCSSNGKILALAEFPGKLVLFDLEKNVFEEVKVDEVRPDSFWNFPYTESLACVKNMKPVVPKKEEEPGEDVTGGGEDGAEDDDDDDDGDFMPGLIDLSEGLRSFLQFHG